MSDDELREQVAEGIADELTERGFMGWFVANSMSDLWAERTPEQEIGRVAAHALLPLIRDHTAAERKQARAAVLREIADSCLSPSMAKWLRRLANGQETADDR